MNLLIDSADINAIRPALQSEGKASLDLRAVANLCCMRLHNQYLCHLLGDRRLAGNYQLDNRRAPNELI